MNTLTLTIPRGTASASLKEKGSEFLGFVFPVTAAEQVPQILEDLRKKYYDATHCCWAYRLYPELIKYSDDGEPAGTAGKRILGAITHADANNILVAVIRYYGGVNLGTGLLGKSYHESAAITLKETRFAVVTNYAVAEIRYGYDYSGRVFSLAGRVAYKLENFMDGEQPGIIIHILPDLLPGLAKELTDACRGNITIMEKDSVFLP